MFTLGTPPNSLTNRLSSTVEGVSLFLNKSPCPNSFALVQTFLTTFGGVPSVNIVDYRMNVIPMGYGPFHHTHADNMSVIDRGTLQAVGETVLSVVYTE